MFYVVNLNDLILHWVIGIELVIPFFQSECDAQQLLVDRFGEIPPSGDFGDFCGYFGYFT